MVLDKINGPNDVKEIGEEELPRLSEEIRDFLIEHLSRTGGHLASNLGTVELTIALHRVLTFPVDQLIWDVGHQSYTHKILTGRKDAFDTLRQTGGLSGFPDPFESDCDAFGTGHSSTSISLGIGMVHARELLGEDYKVVSVIGDGALTGGIAFEALNNASLLKKNLLIILNDNDMSISENVGGMSAHLAKWRVSSGYTSLKQGVHNTLSVIPGGNRIAASIHKTKHGIKQLVIPGMMFEDIGIMYLGPVDGHDISAMQKIFTQAFLVEGPVVVHIKTKKGLGFPPAERLPARFHGTGPFDRETGLPLTPKTVSYTDVFSTVMRKLGDRNARVVAVTAAMEHGTGLKRFHNMFPERFFDVGIAEGHAVTFAAAMASKGLIPIVAVYSSFLQRAYDEILHDVCIRRQHVIFAVDRAGLIGGDGITHQGIFDLSYLSSIPGMMVMAPKNKWELSDMLKFAVAYDGPVAIRYPKGEAFSELKAQRDEIRAGVCEPVQVTERIDKPHVLLFAVGSMVETALRVSRLLPECDITVVNARFVVPFDADYLSKVMGDYDCIVPMEENVASGGFGEHVTVMLTLQGYKGKILPVAVPDVFVPHGSVEDQRAYLGLDAESVAERIREALRDL